MMRKARKNQDAYRVLLACALSASVLGLTPGYAQTYLEIANTSVLLEVGAPEPGEENPLRDETNDEVSRGESATNVGKVSNIASFNDTDDDAQRQLQEHERELREIARSQSGSGVGYGNEIYGVQGLPNPQLDIKNDVLNQVAPITSDMVREILNELHLRQGAAVTPINPGKISQASQYVVDLSPGATPPVVRVSKGIGAIVNFVDSAGNPWPITFARNFHQEAAMVTQMAPHILSVSAISSHLSGSVGVVLDGLTTPINFIVTPGQDATDYRVDLHVPGITPGATPNIGKVVAKPSLGGSSAKDDLMGYLYGSTPEGSTRLEVDMKGNDNNTTRAWQDFRGRLILRTPAQVVSPSWSQRLPSLDGTSVYELPATPIIRVTVDGISENIRIKGLVPALNTNNSVLSHKAID